MKMPPLPSHRDGRTAVQEGTRRSAVPETPWKADNWNNCPFKTPHSSLNWTMVGTKSPLECHLQLVEMKCRRCFSTQRTGRKYKEGRNDDGDSLASASRSAWSTGESRQGLLCLRRPTRSSWKRLDCEASLLASYHRLLHKEGRKERTNDNGNSLTNASRSV